MFEIHASAIARFRADLERLGQCPQRALGVAVSGFESAADGGTAADGDEQAGEGAPGKLKTRADARRVLESVCDFLERTEPAHPAPILIRRAARLLDLSFVDIIRDLAPEAAGTIENLGGIRRESP